MDVIVLTFHNMDVMQSGALNTFSLMTKNFEISVMSTNSNQRFPAIIHIVFGALSSEYFPSEKAILAIMYIVIH